MKHFWGLMMLAGMLALAGGCAPTENVTINGSGGATFGASGASSSSAPVYTAYNVWFEKATHVYSENYHVGSLIPAGTRVMNITIRREINPKITFTTLPGGMTYTMVFVARHHPGLTVDRFMARLFTTKNLSELTRGFSDNELRAVKEGTIRGRMSKQAVIVAYGYPIETYTPTLESNRWTFMDNRFNRTEYEFGDNGYTSVSAAPVRRR